MDRKYMSPDEAAMLLGVGRSTLAKLRMTGGGPAYLKLSPRKVVYEIAELDRWAATHRRRSTSEAAA